MFDLIKKFFGKEEPKPKKTREPRKAKKPKDQQQVSAKELATKNNEPYVAIISVEVDPNNINSGAFELDWNDKFVLNLVKAGYKIKEDDKDSDIVDRWFQTVCRNIALEYYEQDQADPVNRNLREMMTIRSKDLGNGRTEVS